MVPTEETSNSKLSIAIIGGGLGGLALSIGLLPYRDHLTITIYEAAPRFAEIGAGIASGPNAVNVLGLISPDILKGYRKCATFNETRDRDNAWLTFRYGMDRKGEGGSGEGEGKKLDWIWNIGEKGRPLGEISQVLVREGIKRRSCVHRAMFLDEMAALIPDGMARFGKKLSTVEELDTYGDGKGLKLTFKDGETAMADVVIGCDGIKSATRKFVMGNQSIEPKFADIYAYRAMVPSDVARKAIGDDLALNGQLYLGYGGYMISYPVEHGDLINMVALKKAEGMEWNKENWLIPATKEEMLSDLEGFETKLVQLITEYGTRDKWGLFDLPHAEKYYRGRTCLMGDAAHASTPHLGAGSGMAFEDAYILSRLFEGVRNKDDVENALRAYDAVRRPRSQKLVRDSRRTGDIISFSDDEFGDDMGRIPHEVDLLYEWVWDYDIEGSLLEAKQLSGILWPKFLTALHFRVTNVKCAYPHTPPLDIYDGMKLCILDNGFTVAIFVINAFSDQMLPEDIQNLAQVGVIDRCLNPGKEEGRGNHATLVQDRNEPAIKDIPTLQSAQETGTSVQESHGPVTIQYEQTSNNATASDIPSQDPRMQFNFLLHYTKPGKGSLLKFFGKPTTTNIPTPINSSAISSSFVPSFPVPNLSSELDNFMQSVALPILDEYIWSSEINTPQINPSIQYSPQLEYRLQELRSKLITTQQKLFEHSDGDVPYFSEEMRSVLFTVTNLVDFTQLFFDHWYPNCPIIHQPTYNLETVSLPLLFVVFLIGAAYSSPRDTASLAVSCGALCEDFVFEDDDLKSLLRTERGGEDSASLQIVQAAFLVSVLQNWQNGPLARTRMCNRRYCEVVNIARILGLTSSRNMYATGIYPFDWIGYVEAEAKVRVMTLIYLVDSHYTLFNKFPPRLMIGEMIGDISSSDEAFAATDALVCEGYLIGTNEESRASLATSIEWLMGDEWDPIHHHGLTTLNLFTFLNCK
ncbi:hypothetical protein SBOR_6869 [Sclerotinia borealis F-4128]|uniref:FAD-binding domain-containing protein n=1 Tax=Sclerotinia borealis (strain F-4128) TaxID=1432307 RepID=W9C7L1_SCLBF|nr:hypothetical protein SBOR_6869 [Sclerotinia borealis F-4128]